ncbi:MAG: GNAT family N-acetyltransferase [Terracidiphilus sp.]|jgi:ribosomal protein S18 acetylase RimI-like enzyme
MLQTRVATPNDAALIATHRKAMFAAMQSADEATLEIVRRNSEPWIVRMMREDKYLGWITSEEAQPVASAGLLILDWPPLPLDPSGEQRGYLLNIFVEPDFRKRGIAHELVRLCLSEADRRHIGVVTLHASDAGRSIYEGFGFRATSEMLLAKQHSGWPSRP